MSWDQIFVLGWAPHPQWFQWLHPGLVTLSVLVAVATSVMAMQIAGLARDAASPRIRRVGVLTVSPGDAAATFGTRVSRLVYGSACRDGVVQRRKLRAHQIH